MSKKFTVTKAQFSKMIGVLGFRLIADEDKRYGFVDYYAVKGGKRIKLTTKYGKERVDWRNCLVDFAWSKH